MDRQADQTNKRFEAVNQRLDAVNRRFDDMGREFADLRERMARLEGVMEGFVAGRRESWHCLMPGLGAPCGIRRCFGSTS